MGTFVVLYCVNLFSNFSVAVAVLNTAKSREIDNRWFEFVNYWFVGTAVASIFLLVSIS